MAKTVAIESDGRGLPAAIRGFLQAVLTKGGVSAVLVPARLPAQAAVMPVLLADPGRLEAAEPLTPAFMVNAARMVSRLTRRPAGGEIAALMRPCEIRAFIELVKLNQGRTEELVIIGIDCPGALANRDYFRRAAADPAALAAAFEGAALAGGGAAAEEALGLAAACRVCEAPVPEGADVAIALFAAEPGRGAAAIAQSARGESLLGKLGLPEGAAPPGRAQAIERLKAERTARRDAMIQQTRAATDSLEKLAAYLARCVNCYNCRVACPVCYCRECVFTTDVFDHEPAQYLRWAGRQGAVKMPADTLFYHLTRMAHMSAACVGCGQCANACPNEIPLAELFRCVAHRTQAAFGYAAGRSAAEKPPLAEFREEEFAEVVGLQCAGRQEGP
jgi:formate dehydrogenase subunit beta